MSTKEEEGKTDTEEQPPTTTSSDEPATSDDADATDPPSPTNPPPPAPLETFDIAIVGAGPSGAFAAYQLRQLHPSAKIAVFDCESSVGGAQVQTYDSNTLSTNPRHGDWIKHAEHSSTDFDPATSTVLASIVNDLRLPVKPRATPTDSRTVFFNAGTKYQRGNPEELISAFGSHPEAVVEQCIEAWNAQAFSCIHFVAVKDFTRILEEEFVVVLGCCCHVCILSGSYCNMGIRKVVVASCQVDK